ncbi:ER-based factor for assembly of V-ATPase [Wolffia australiana]
MDSGLIIAMNQGINEFLLAAAREPRLSPDFQELVSNLLNQKSIPYKSLRDIWLKSSPQTRPSLRRLLTGCHFVFQSPKPREKSEELKERLRKLEAMAERKAYRELIKDIVPKEEPSEPFSSYKDQLGFGVHVVVMMFTGYLVGFTAFRALFNHSAVMNAAGGILGLVCSMLLETTLFIIRTSSSSLSSSSPSPSSTSTYTPASTTKKNQ